MREMWGEGENSMKITQLLSWGNLEQRIKTEALRVKQTEVGKETLRCPLRTEENVSKHPEGKTAGG